MSAIEDFYRFDATLARHHQEVMVADGYAVIYAAGGGLRLPKALLPTKEELQVFVDGIIARNLLAVRAEFARLAKEEAQRALDDITLQLAASRNDLVCGNCGARTGEPHDAELCR